MEKEPNPLSPENQKNFPRAERVNIYTSPVTKKEMATELSNMQEAVATEAEVETDESEMAPETMPETVPYSSEMSREQEAEVIEGLRERLKREAPPTQMDAEVPPEGPERGGGDDNNNEGARASSSSHESSTHYEYVECTKCKGTGSRFLIFACSKCHGSGRVVASAKSTSKTNKVEAKTG